MKRSVIIVKSRTEILKRISFVYHGKRCVKINNLIYSLDKLEEIGHTWFYEDAEIIKKSRYVCL